MKIKTLPGFRYHPLHRGKGFGGGGGPTLPEIYRHHTRKTPQLKADRNLTCIVSGYVSKKSYRNLRDHRCKDWVFRGDMLLKEAKRIVREQKFTASSGKDLMRQVYEYVESRNMFQIRAAKTWKAAKLLLLVWQREKENIRHRKTAMTRHAKNVRSVPQEVQGLVLSYFVLIAPSTSMTMAVGDRIENAP